MLVVVPFTTEFLDNNNRLLIDRFAELIDLRTGPLREKLPPGLRLSLSGSATVGRDMLQEGPSQWISSKTGIPAVLLPYTVGGTPEARDLFGLFDDTLQRLLKGVR